MKNASNLLVILVFCILGEGFCILFCFSWYCCILSLLLMFCQWCCILSSLLYPVSGDDVLSVVLYGVVCCCVVCSFFRLCLFYFRFSVYLQYIIWFCQFCSIIIMYWQVIQYFQYLYQSYVMMNRYKYQVYYFFYYYLQAQEYKRCVSCTFLRVKISKILNIAYFLI